MLFTPQDIALINTFAELGDGYMEQKDITRLEKLLDRALVQFAKDCGIEKSERVTFYIGISWFKPMTVISQTRRYVDEDYEYYAFKHKQKTEADQKAIDGLTKMNGLFMPMASTFFRVKEIQWMRNGVIPKSLIKKPTPTECIKGRLSKVFQPMVTELSNSLRENEEKRWNDILENKGKVNHVTWNSLENSFMDVEVSKKLIAVIIEDTVAGFVYRLCDKLGGIEPKSKLAEIKYHIHSDKRFSIVGVFENKDVFSMSGKVVWNTSPLGTSFLQYPITFHELIVDGKVIPNSELNFKKLFRETNVNG